MRASSTGALVRTVSWSCLSVYLLGGEHAATLSIACKKSSREAFSLFQHNTACSILPCRKDIQGVKRKMPFCIM